ncbi:MAG: type IV secretory system conjugative DNA transfer family protein [Minisyncoccia bacterium]
MITKIFDMIISVIEGTLKTIFEVLESMVSSLSSKQNEYKADFASQGTLLSSWNNGFCLTGNKNLSLKHSFQNALIIGGTGAGKSSVVLIPCLFSMKGSFIVHDPSGELYTKSAGYLEQKGYEIKILNFAHPEISSNYNPLSRAKNSTDIQKVASMLVENSLGGGKKDPFWNNLAISLITVLIQILKTQPEEYQNLYNVRNLLNSMGGNPEAVDALFSKNASEKLFYEYKSFLAYDEKVTSGVIATCKASLQIFNDENIGKVTSGDNIPFEEFRNKPTVLYIQNSVADQRYYSTLTSIFFEQLFSYTLSRFPKQDEQNIFFLIDECSSLHLPTLALATANVRKHSAGIMLIIQDFNQIVHHYGKYESDAIRANCFAKLYFTGQSLETAKELEQILGKYEFKDKDERKVVRPLMTNDEIRTMKETRAILVCGHYPPILAKLHPYYKSIRYRKYSLIPPPTSKSANDIDIVPVLPLPITAKINEQKK